MKKLLQETCRTVAKREEKYLIDKEYANLQKRYRNILTCGGKELSEIPTKPKGKRGRIAKSDAHNLWERLKNNETAVLLFARDQYVPFTNNRAEKGPPHGKSEAKNIWLFREGAICPGILPNFKLPASYGQPRSQPARCYSDSSGR